ncbi:LysR family transcriptional regulator [Geothrix limicola]|uniref:LysR family transcriptional regulator n=1 Tax=Geothrix limicola TaxID=2927978 RepID=A0ABQ5QGD7_9BACT|nr:LysR substrate-binding domain-containing protein [Geothrix limicola]GLH73654.1 LysR family transcriptional regulator [Geothrix limicola]
MFPELDPRRLETFRVVAQSGQVSAAARSLNLSQPAVTAQIRQLESDLGKSLFTRHASGMRLTEVGRVLLDYARRVHRLLEEAGQRIHAEESAGGELRLAASTTAAAYILPPLIRTFLTRHRPAPLVVDVANTDEVLGWVREGRTPLALMEGLTRAPGLSLRPYLRDELVAVRAAKAPAALAEVSALADLAGVPLIWRESGSGTRVVVERALRKARVAHGPRGSDLVVGDTEAIKSCVLLGLGIGFLSRWSIQRELGRRALEEIPLPELSIQRSFSWVQTGGGLAGQAAAFLRHAQQHPPAPMAVSER